MNDRPGLRTSRRPWARLAALAAACTIGLATPPVAPAFADNAAATPPGQPISGPGGSAYPHTGYTVGSGGSGANAWYVFAPAGPTVSTAPVTIILHGYGEFSGHGQMDALIEHTARQGNIVIYPRWQTSPLTPLPIMQDAIGTAVTGIKGALAYLRADPSRPQPQLDKATYFGHSYGGVITADITNRYASLGLPAPRVIVYDEPDGGPFDDDGFDATMAGVPSTTRVSCLISDWYASNEPTHGCYALWPEYAHIPSAGKDFVRVHTDTYGTPDLNAVHGMSSNNSVDAIDYYAVWKTWDAQRGCALADTWCGYLNNTPAQRYMGAWSDGTPVVPLTVADTAITY